LSLLLIINTQNNPDQVAFAKALHERIRRECTCITSHHEFLPYSKGKKSYLSILINVSVPELRIYRFIDGPVGPHPIAMFEVNLFTPAQFGAFIPWLVINRGPLSALVHPNTITEGEDLRNHTQRATWLGERVPLDLRILKLMEEREREEKRKEEEKEEEGKK
jgi:aromatic ring-cleaving dioxygenase